MIDCAGLRERMAAASHGTLPLTDVELDHIAACAECASEWQLVQRGALLHDDIVVDAAGIADTVLARLRAEPAERAIRRMPWRGGVIGLLAAAASVVLILSAPRVRHASTGSVGDTSVLAILPELQALDARQLEKVLQSLGPTAGDATPGVLPHLEDLTDGELEQLLHSEGGE